MRTTALILMVVLMAAVGVTIAGSYRQRKPSFTAQLHALLCVDSESGPWRLALHPIADTPEMQKAVGELLSYDDGVFAIYTQGARRISVYLAYWRPGKMSHRLVAVHTPDVCWVGGGWKRVDGGVWTGLGGTVGGGRWTVDGGQRSEVSVQPGEWRTFVMNGQTEHVVFWHLVGGKSKSYGTGYAPPWWSPLLDLWEKGLNQREEQFFVRISSNGPIEQIWNEPIVQHVIARIPGLMVKE